METGKETKSLKSLQAHAQEVFWQLSPGGAGAGVSAGAVTHARAKLRPSAFVEFNQGVLHTVCMRSSIG